MRKKTNSEFINESIIMHGNKYDYTSTVYINSNTKVDIICNVCGDTFDQKPSHHINGRGCPNCAGNKKSNTNEFIINANRIHNNRYAYTKSIYKNTDTPISIICNIHGEFTQTPYNHLNGQGCPKCSNNISLGNDKFSRKAKNIHGSFYDYSIIDYKNNSTKIKIICPKHGIFLQTPAHHLRGQGCPKCRMSHGERKIAVWLETNHIPFDMNVKFQDCVYKRELPFDFYIPTLQMCIEFDGEQHYKPMRYTNNKNTLQLIQLRDSIKTQYCKKHKIMLLRIPYTEFHNIEYILENHI